MRIYGLRLILGAALAVSSLQAVPFYSGTQTGWTVFGNGATLTLASIGDPAPTILSPTSNPTFVLLSTGPGDAATFETFSNSFSIGAGGGSILFSYWFLTSEFTGEGAASPGIDSYSVAISGPTATTITGDVSEAGFTCFDDPNCQISAIATLPSSFVELFSYKKYSPAAISLAPGNYSIAFGVFDDTGSGAFDSALLIDSVVVTDNTANGVPEPGTMWLAAGGICLFLGLRKR